ncbi:P1 family peptidase [Nitratireductor soli]|uniref:DmpA family aminopeptidase n=1 Tax=Nitratireductor soli TaxID=1670619 RepID=UPI00065E4036|nr:P1 family peptidase [Nitratireductor soli]
MSKKDPAIRARDLGLDLAGESGPFNAITDVAGIAVGMTTLIEDTPRPGRARPARTGVTAILPRGLEETPTPVWAGVHRFNGNGEMTGTHWIEDGGYFLGPVLLTNTHAVGVAHQAATRWMLQRHARTFDDNHPIWLMPVVAETYDGLLNDINGLPVSETDVLAALDAARPGPVAEGNTGGGTGMVCYEFKGGTGTASRRLEIGGQAHTIGVLVQANHGIRDWLSILGAPVGRHLRENRVLQDTGERGSIVVVIATDIPMAPHQLARLARRGSIGIGRGGTCGGNSSGDIFLAFTTANERPLPHQTPPRFTIEMVNDDLFDPIYEAAIQATEEAVINAMVAARDMGGTPYDRARVTAIDHAAMVDILGRYGRLRA